MPYAPRPFTVSLYAESDFSVLERLKFHFSGVTPPHPYQTECPVCFQSNIDLLESLGFTKSVPTLLEVISPGKLMLAPDRDMSGMNNPHFLQQGFALNKSEDVFIYEISGCMYSAGLLFCHTPADVSKNLEVAGFKTGKWMLDQVVFHSQDKSFPIAYAQHDPKTFCRAGNILSYIQATTAQIEKGDNVSALTIFENGMNDFENRYFVNYKMEDPTRKLD